MNSQYIFIQNLSNNNLLLSIVLINIYIIFHATGLNTMSSIILSVGQEIYELVPISVKGLNRTKLDSVVGAANPLPYRDH